MSLRPRKEEPPARGFSLLASGGLVPPAPTSAQAGLSFDVSDVGAALRTVAPSPYNDKAHLEPREFEDHDGGPWEEAPRAQPKFEAVPQKWVVAPALGSQAPAICVFPRRLSNNISFAPDVHLSFSAVWTPIIARFTNLFLTDVDKKGNMPGKAQQQHWLCTFKGKTATSLTSMVLRIRVNSTGDQLEGWALYLRECSDQYRARAMHHLQIHSDALFCVSRTTADTDFVQVSTQSTPRLVHRVITT